MPMKSYVNNNSPSDASNNFCPCFSCKGKSQPTWQDVGDKRWYCKDCWEEWEEENHGAARNAINKKKKIINKSQPALGNDTKKKNSAKPKSQEKAKKKKTAEKKQKEDKKEKKKASKKNETKKKKNQKSKSNPPPRPIPKRREEELTWEFLEELTREACRMRDVPSSPENKKKPTSTTSTAENPSQEDSDEKNAASPKAGWCHPEIAKTRGQICVHKKWMAHSKKAMYRTALESVAKAAKDLYTPPPPPPTPSSAAPPVAAATETTTSTTAPVEENAAANPASMSAAQKKKQKRKSNKKEASKYVPFPVESLAFLPSLIHAVEATTRAVNYATPEIQRLLDAFLEKAWDQEEIQKEKKAVEEVKKKLQEERAMKLKEKIAAKEKEAAAARAEVPEIPPAEDAPTVVAEEQPAELPTAKTTPPEEKKKKNKKPKMPKITEHMILRALPSEIQQSRNQRMSFKSQLQTYVSIVPRTGVSLSVGIAALYIVYSRCTSHDLYAILVRFQEHFQRCAPAQNQAVSYIINLAGSLVASSSSSSSTSTTEFPAAADQSKYDSLLRAKEKLHSIFEEYMDDHKERAIKSAIVEPSEFIGICSGDQYSADHVEANGRWIYLTAVVEGLGGGSDRVKEGTSELQLPVPVLQGEDQYQIGAHFAWDAIKEDEAAAFKDPLHFGTSGFRNVKLLKERAAEGGRTKKTCRDYRYQSDKGAIGNLREMFQVKNETYEEELKLWAKNIDAFAFFFSKDFFIKRCFETLNTESRPEYAGFRTACFTVFEHYLVASASEDPKCTTTEKEMKKESTTALSIEDQLYEFAYSDEYCTELNVDNVFKFFQWIGIAKPASTQQQQDNKSEEEEVEEVCKCGLECHIEELAAAAAAAKKKGVEKETTKQPQQEEEGYGQTKQQDRVDEVDGRRRNKKHKGVQKNKHVNAKPEEAAPVQRKQQQEEEEEVAPPPMLIDDGFAMTKTKSFEIEPEPPLFVVAP